MRLCCARSDATANLFVFLLQYSHPILTPPSLSVPRRAKKRPRHRVNVYSSLFPVYHVRCPISRKLFMKILYRLIFGETPRYCPIFLRGMTRAPTPILQAARLAFWFFITILSKGFLLSLPYSLCAKPSILASVTIDLSPGKPLHCFCGGVSPPARRPGRGDTALVRSALTNIQAQYGMVKGSARR